MELLLFDGNGIHVHDWGLAVDTSERTNMSSLVMFEFFLFKRNYYTQLIKRKSKIDKSFVTCLDK